MDSKDEISDTDSGIILQSGPDSPTSPVKELAIHTRAMRIKHQELEDRLQRCLQELKKLCIREAELTGRLPSDYPLLPGEKPPRVRKRIGAAFSVDKDSIRKEGEDPELISLEAKLALQQRILEAARKLCLEEHLSRSVRRSRLQQCKNEEKKVKELQRALSQRVILRPSPAAMSTGVFADLGTSDDSSLSDAAVLDEEVEQSQLAQKITAPPPLEASDENPQHKLQDTRWKGQEAQRLARGQSEEYECSPIQNSPWKESSLDQPYHKPKKPQSASSSQSCSPAVTPSSTPVESHIGEASIRLNLAHVMDLALGQGQANSAPCTPELHPRHQHSQQSQQSKSFRLPKYEISEGSNKNRGSGQLPQRRSSDLSATPPEYSQLKFGIRKPLYASSSEDSSSEHSVPSYTSSPCRETPGEMARPCPPPYGYHYMGHHKSHYDTSPHGNVTSLQSNSTHNSPSYPFYTSPHNRQHVGGPAEVQGPSFSRTPQLLSNCSFSRDQVGKELPYHPGLETGRPHISPTLLPPPPTLGNPPRYESWHDNAPSRQAPRVPPPHVRLARGPSLREYPQHHGREPAQGLVTEELRSWRQRTQTREVRSRSLDRVGAVREYHQHPAQPKVSQRRILQRAPDGTPMQWFEEEDSEIVSQV